MAALAVSCSKGTGECLALPCPAPIAVYLTITSSVSSALVSGAVVQQLAPGSGSTPCNTTCLLPGSAGTYQLAISAPGFTTVHLTVQVRGTSATCGCDTVETEHIALALVPSP